MIKSTKLPLYIFYGLLAYVPLHIFLSTWVGSSFGILDITKNAKDVFLLAGFSLALLATPLSTIKTLASDRLTIAIFFYALLSVVSILLFQNDLDAELLGLMYNLRFLVFLIYGILMTRIYGNKAINSSIKIVAASSLVVSIIGIFQYLYIPDDFLRHFGYTRENGVLPVFYIDDKVGFERIMSTIRDPNSLGSYLLIPLSIFSVFLIRAKKNTRLLAFGLVGVTSLAVLLTFSRSAWIGALLAVATACLLSEEVKMFVMRRKKMFSLSAFFVIVVLLAGFVLLNNNSDFQNIFYHADEKTVLEDPNQKRARYFRESVDEIVEEPFGHGVGSAGLASIRNSSTVLNENYYLQIGYEVGLLGLLGFLAILMIVFYRLWGLKNSFIGIFLIASFVGLAFTNLLVHIWSNEAVAYTWWGLAGVALGFNAEKSKKTKKNN